MNILTNLQFTFHNTIELYKTLLRENKKLLMLYTACGVALIVMLYTSMYWVDMLDNIVDEKSYQLDNNKSSVFTICYLLFGLFALALRDKNKEEIGRIRFKEFLQSINVVDYLLVFVTIGLVILFSRSFKQSLIVPDELFYESTSLWTIFSKAFIYKHTVLLVYKIIPIIIISILMLKKYNITLKRLIGAAFTCYLLFFMYQAIWNVILGYHSLITYTIIINPFRTAVEYDTLLWLFYLVIFLVTAILSSFMIPGFAGTILYSNIYYVDNIKEVNNHELSKGGQY